MSNANTSVDYEAMELDQLVAEHNALDEQRQALNEQMAALDAVRSAKEFAADQANAQVAREAANPGEVQTPPPVEAMTTVDPNTGKEKSGATTVATAGTESGEAVGPK